MIKLLLIALLGFSFSFGGDFIKADANEADCFKCLQSKSRKECRERGDCPENDEFKSGRVR